MAMTPEYALHPLLQGSDILRDECWYFVLF